MATQRFVVMGAGEVGFHLARKFDQDGHDVVVIDSDPEKQARVEEHLDVNFVLGSGTEVGLLQRAAVDGCELFVAASDNEEANLNATLLAKDLGARRAVVRLESLDAVGRYRSLYERLFRADLILSSKGLAVVEVLNLVLGHHTHEIDFLAEGQIQLRTIEIQNDSVMTRKRLRDIAFPAGSLIVGYLDQDHELSIPKPEDSARAGGQAIVLCTRAQIREVEELFASQLTRPGHVVIAGAGRLGAAIATSLRHEVDRLQILERDRRRAQALAELMPKTEILCADATDVAVQRARENRQARQQREFLATDQIF